MACDAADEDKFEFNIWLHETSKCYKNVHPDESNVYLINKDETIIASPSRSGGILDWSAKTMADWEARVTSNFELWGREGDVRKLFDLMNSLGIYEAAGGCK